MTDKLSEYELLNIMDGVFSYYLAELGHERDKPRIRQTKKQIVALIQKEAERDEIEARHIDIVIDLYDQLEKKPQITEKFVEKHARKIVEGIFRREYTMGNSQTLKALKQMLKKAGVKVMRK